MLRRFVESGQFDRWANRVIDRSDAWCWALFYICLGIMIGVVWHMAQQGAFR